MPCFSRLIATRHPSDHSDPALAAFRENNELRLDVDKETSLEEAILQVHNSDFIPKQYTCNYTARLPLARFHPAIGEMEYADLNLRMDDELHIHNDTLYLSCSLSPPRADMRSFDTLPHVTRLLPPAAFLRRLVTAGFCDAFAELCDSSFERRLPSGSTALPKLIKLLKTDHGLRAKRHHTSILIEGLEGDLQLALHKADRQKTISATFSNLSVNRFGISHLSTVNLCNDAMIVSGHAYGSETHLRHTRQPFLSSAEEFARVTLAYIDLTYQLNDVLLEFPETPEKSLWRRLKDEEDARLLAQMAALAKDFGKAKRG